MAGKFSVVAAFTISSLVQDQAHGLHLRDPGTKVVRFRQVNSLLFTAEAKQHSFLMQAVRYKQAIYQAMVLCCPDKFAYPAGVYIPFSVGVPKRIMEGVGVRLIPCSIGGEIDGLVDLPVDRVNKVVLVGDILLQPVG